MASQLCHNSNLLEVQVLRSSLHDFRNVVLLFDHVTEVPVDQSNFSNVELLIMFINSFLVEMPMFQKFFVRCLKQDVGEKFVCSRGKGCIINKETRTQCQYCRYHKCLSLGMYKPGR